MTKVVSFLVNPSLDCFWIPPPLGSEFLMWFRGLRFLRKSGYFSKFTWVDEFVFSLQKGNQSLY